MKKIFFWGGFFFNQHLETYEKKIKIKAIIYICKMYR